MPRKRLALLVPFLLLVGIVGFGVNAIGAPGDVTCKTQTATASASVSAITYSDGGSRSGTIPGASDSNTATATACATEPAPITVRVTTTVGSTTSQPPAPSICDETLTVGSISSFVNGLSVGQVGCLYGSFTQDVTINAPGVTLQSVPGTTASICGTLVVNDSADNISVKNLNLDGSCAGSSAIGIYIRGDGDTFEGNEITNHRQGSSCMLIGQNYDLPATAADNTTIRRNVIHGCGIDPTRDQGIYVYQTTGTLIEDNTIYDTSAFAMQYWGQVTNTRYQYNVSDGGPTTSRGNLIVGADSDTPPFGNFVNNNIITGTQHAAFEGGFGGTNNLVSDNCVWQTQGMFAGSDGWTDGGGNITADPLFVDRANHNYALQPNSPCAGDGPR